MHGIDLHVGSGWPLVSRILDVLVIGYLACLCIINEIPQGAPEFRSNQCCCLGVGAL